MAWSKEIFCHSPLTSFIGDFSRRSPCTSSRTEAPLAQCEPRLIGLSQAGSWPTQTPFCTSAITVQPTEQCVQTFFLISVGAPTIFGPACALRTEPSGIRPIAAPAPAARPDRRRNVRRSRTPDERLAATPCKRALPADPSLRLINMCVVPSIAVDAIVVFDVIGFPVARLAALGLRLIRRSLAARKRHDRSRGDRRPAHQKQAAPIDTGGLRLTLAGKHFAVRWLAHCDLPLGSPSSSVGQREGLGFQFHEDTAGATDGAVEARRLRYLQVCEH